MKTHLTTVRMLSLFSIVVTPLIFFYITMPEAAGARTLTSIIFGLLFQVGAMSSASGLYLLRVTGDSPVGRLIPLLQALLHALAALFQIFEYQRLEARLGLLYTVTDLAWPFGFLFWLATGSAVLWAGRWQGWQRFVPISCALPLLSLIIVGGLWGKEAAGGVFGTLLTVFFMLLAFVLFRQSDEETRPAVAQPSF